ncbi:hypothetical protein C8J57DRAFT_1310591 [Mycena rebaudengoi]|nr:hypothetical protein C8J57DRAFT_1310591 [Mycena rebaudengoi]
MPHLWTALISALAIRIHLFGFDSVLNVGQFVPGQPLMPQVLYLIMLMVRVVAVWWATTWMYLSCIILFDRTDILTRKHASPVYLDIEHFILRTGYSWFTRIAKPAPFPDPWLAYPPAADSEHGGIELY